MSEANLTERQRKWFASVQAGLERQTEADGPSGSPLPAPARRAATAHGWRQ